MTYDSTDPKMKGAPNGRDDVRTGPEGEPTILIVDDDADIRSILNLNLSEAGYRVIEAESGRSALTAVNATPPDLVLLDLMMPEMDGYEVLRQLRNDPMHGHLPVILLSAKSDLFSKIRGLDSGADDYITKPFSMHELVSRTRSVLKRSLDTRHLHFEVTSLEQVAGADLGSMRWECFEAARLQQLLVTKDPPTVAGLELAGRLLPARFVGGDFFDLIPLPDQRVAVLIGDVAGKGIPAAMLMVMIVSLFRHLVQEDPAPERVLGHLNRHLRDSLEHGTVLATAHAGLLEVPRCTYSYASAGHLPALLFRSQGRSLALTTEAGYPLGLDTAVYESYRFGLEPGDLLALFTDGVVDLKTGGTRNQGLDGLQAGLAPHVAEPLPTLCARLEQQLGRGDGGPGARDDAAFVFIRFVAGA